MMKTGIAAAMAVALAGGAAFAGPGKFSKADKDGDGRVSVSELDQRHRAYLAAADADKDGFISEDEMKAFREKKESEMKARRFPDKNNDGFVDRSEYQDAAWARFDKLDTNRDGRLSEEELSAGYRSGHGHRDRP